eukprot:scaffold13861_cov15-Tisochrysis_lutea.AAC.1
MTQAEPLSWAMSSRFGGFWFRPCKDEQAHLASHLPCIFGLTSKTNSLCQVVWIASVFKQVVDGKVGSAWTQTESSCPGLKLSRQNKSIVTEAAKFCWRAVRQPQCWGPPGWQPKQSNLSFPARQTHAPGAEPDSGDSPG